MLFPAHVKENSPYMVIQLPRRICLSVHRRGQAVKQSLIFPFVHCLCRHWIFLLISYYNPLISSLSAGPVSSVIPLLKVFLSSSGVLSPWLDYLTFGSVIRGEETTYFLHLYEGPEETISETLQVSTYEL